jgi:hypothetical protein
MDTNNPKDRVAAAKPPLHLVPPALKIHVSQAMAYGAFTKGYGPYNWRDTNVRLTVYIAACMRHLESLLDGENAASDSKVHHAAHCAAGCGIILDAMEQGTLIDDRPKAGSASRLLERFTAKKSEAPVPQAKNCTREIGHSGPCNGWPCATALKAQNDACAKKKVYLAGPMRGIKDFNFPAFFEAEEQLRARGYEVFNPARRDAEHYGAGITKIASGSEEEAAAKTGFNIREALGADCDWITKHADMVVFLPGWENSTGCQAEHALAVALHLEIKTLHEMLCNEHDSMFWNELDHKP